MIKYPLAVTIDTNIFDAAKYDFSEKSTLSLLVDFVKRGKVKVVLSHIVIEEAKRHLAAQTKKILSISRNLRADILNETSEHLVKYLGLDRLLVIDNKDELVKKSIELFDDYIKSINAEILESELINLDSIINDYFQIKPPFQSGEKKRKEFPDAFIACQIRERFGEEEQVAIISNDSGFNSACKTAPNHFFFESLGQLYDAINKDEIMYNDTVDSIENLKLYICFCISEYIKDNESIDVRGRSVDKDGIESGYNYDEFYIKSVKNTSFRVWSVDEMSEQSSIVTLLCNTEIVVDCFYKDYDNAPWDSSIKDYAYVDTINIREKHNAKFGCRLEINRTEKEITIFPFLVVLGGDSRKQRYKVVESESKSYEQDYYNTDRKELGFCSLEDYESYLEEDLSNSKFEQDIVQQFEEIESLYKAFEDISFCYDSLLEKLNTENVNDIAVQLSCKLKDISDISDFPVIPNKEEITEDEIWNIRQWCENKCEKAVKINELCLPDTISFGETIIIQGVNYDKLLFTINELEISPTEGDEETIDISISSTKEQIGQGYIKLTVGYLHFDDEGQVGDGLEESIEYEYSEIIDVLCDFIKEQNAILKREKDIIDIIESIVNTYE